MEKRKTSKLITGAALILVGVGLLFWALTARDAAAPATESSDSNTSQTDTAPSGDSSSEDPNTAVSNDNQSQAIIIFTNDGFSPEELEVKKGTRVTVRNESNQRVQFSSDDHPTHRINEGMNLPTLSPGESDSFTVDEVGEWGFHDHIDASFTGTLTVVD